MEEVPYLLRGVLAVETESSVLISSSKYLNHPRLREWLAMICLRKNGPDFPPQAEMHEMIQIWEELRDEDEINQRLTDERKVNPALDRWFEEGFYSTYELDDLKAYPTGSLGRIFYDQLTNGGYEINIVPFKEPE